MTRFRPWICLIGISLAMSISTGCLLNIPSLRHADMGTSAPKSPSGQDGYCEEELPWGGPPQASKKDKIPWPQYHPLPTRPVFGPQY